MALGVAGRYIRQSSGKADGSEASPQDQRDQTAEEAERRELALYGTAYEDIGRSGWDPSAVREGFNRLLKDAAARKFDHIIVHYLSRFTRLTPQDALPTILQLWSYGITIVSVTEGVFQPNDFVSLITVIVRMEGNNRESSNKSAAVAGAKRKAREAGGYVGGRSPYGLTTRKEMRGNIAVQLLTPEPEEAKVLRAAALAALYSPGATLTDLASELTIRGIPGRQNEHRMWDATTVRRYLEDPRIAGYDAEPILITDSGERVRHPLGFTYNRDPATGAPLLLDFEAPLSPEEWHGVQDWLKGRTRGRTAVPGESLFSGAKLLFCECGYPMSRFAPVSTGVRSYRCPRAKLDHTGRTHTGGNTISLPAVDDYVARRIFALISAAEGDEEALTVLAEATLRYGRRVESPVRAGEREAAESDQRHLTDALTELYGREEAPEYANPIGRRHWSERVLSYAGQLRAVEARLAVLTEAEIVRLPIQQWFPEDPDLDPIGPGSWWHSADTEARREFVSLFVSRITVSKSASLPGRPRILDVSKRVRVEFAGLDQRADSGDA
jgi:Site-specific recombinases, DNA invertase Pin homologs